MYLGDKCGATFVDMEFIYWLKRKIGPVHYQKLDSNNFGRDMGPHAVIGPDLRLVMEDFEKLKKRYTGDARDNVDVITLPGELYDVTDEPRGIREGEIRLTE